MQAVMRSRQGECRGDAVPSAGVCGAPPSSVPSSHLFRMGGVGKSELVNSPHCLRREWSRHAKSTIQPTNLPSPLHSIYIGGYTTRYCHCIAGHLLCKFIGPTWSGRKNQLWCPKRCLQSASKSTTYECPPTGTTRPGLCKQQRQHKRSLIGRLRHVDKQWYTHPWNRLRPDTTKLSTQLSVSDL